MSRFNIIRALVVLLPLAAGGVYYRHEIQAVFAQLGSAQASSSQTSSSQTSSFQTSSSQADSSHASSGGNTDISTMSFPLYPEQKVVYHLFSDGGFRNRGYRNLMVIANHHIDAVGEGWLDLRIVMQGDGINLLAAAKDDPALAASIDRLKAKGVRFLLCKNTLTYQGIDPYTRLHGVKREDVVGAAIAEVASLVQQGFVNLKF